MPIGSAELSALAALAGSAIGGITPILSNQVIQRGLTQRELLGRELADRQALYSDFIRAAANAYVKAATTRADRTEDLVQLYAIVGRIRLAGSAEVIDAAEQVSHKIAHRYSEDPLTPEALREAVLEPHVDPLHDFSRACREELHDLLRHGVR